MIRAPVVPFALLGLLTGCAWVTDAEYARRLDADEDGHVALALGGDDCDDADAAVHPGAEERCDALDNDCDGEVDPPTSADAIPWYADGDGDGYGTGEPSTACPGGAGGASRDGDCAPSDAAVNPGATEAWYDGVDQDCDGNDDDQDGDGAPLAEDCDDEDASVHPGAEEAWYDGVDQDCDGDDDDQDGDGTPVAEDCDDEDAAIHPGAEDPVDAVDQDCDGLVADADGDGHDPTTWGGGDCDDADPDVHPDAAEVCDRFDADEDCDGLADDADDGAQGRTTWYDDADGDGYGDPATATARCDAAAGQVDEGRDCDDADADVSPPTGACTVTLGAESASATLGGEGAGDFAGSALCVADLTGDGAPDVAVGAWGRDGSGSTRGAVHVAGGPLSGDVPLSGEAIVEGPYDGEGVGSAVACGDLDDDGQADLLVGASGGAGAWMVRGPIGADVGLEDADAVLDADDDTIATGYALAVGDWDGDGAMDALVGAPLLATGGLDAGGAYVVLGPISGTTGLGAAETILFGTEAAYGAGWAVANAGDVDGDGDDDMLLGGPLTGNGKAWLVGGGALGDVDLADADATLVGEHPDSWAGLAVAGAGDTDGDGYDDLLVGAPYAVEGGWDAAGTAYLVRGPVNGIVDLGHADFHVASETGDDTVGYAVASAGDVDGDGHIDLAVGGVGEDTRGAAAGAAWVFLGPLNGSRTIVEADVRMLGEAAGDELGTAIAAGDLDGDGLDDLLFGAPDAAPAGTSTGAAYLLLAADVP